MDNNSSSVIHIIPLILVAIILVVVLCSRLLNWSYTSNTTGQTQTSLRPELDIPGEEEPLLSLVEAQNALPEQGSRIESARDTLTRLNAEIDRWRDADARKADDIARLRQDLSTSASKNVELQRRYEALSTELEAARLFLNTADAFADSEIIQMLAKLNTELQHISTSIAEHVVGVFGLGALVSESEQQSMVDRVSKSIGSTLALLLWTTKGNNPEVPMYLQIAFQACLTYHLCRIVSSWTLDEGRDAFLDGIYRRLRESEKQAISGRWRFLARAYTLTTCVKEPDSLVAPIIAGLCDIILVAGCAAPRSDIMSELSSTFEKKILVAVSLAGRLNQMISGVVSGDFEVFVVRPGETFREETMQEDLDGSGNGTPGETRSAQTVLCTSELGLAKLVQSRMGEKVTKTVIKTKVILESFLGNEGQ